MKIKVGACFNSIFDFLKKKNMDAKPMGWTELALFEKVRWYRDHLTPAYAPFVDKLTAKERVREMLPNEIEQHRLHIPRVLRILDEPHDVSRDDLRPDRVIKAAHGSNWNLFPGRGDTVQGCQRALARWNRVYRAPDGGPVEPQYAYLQPRFFIEERLLRPFLNVKVRCIRGRAIPFITVTRHQQKNFYDFAWNLLRPAEIGEVIPRPSRLDELLRMAEVLAQPFEFVRVDFYVDDEDQIHFSEWTFTPSNGQQILSREQELELGRTW